MATERGQNERALVCAAQRGDKEALQLLFRHNWAWLRGLVYSIVRNADDIDDILQDICVRVIGKIKSLRRPDRFRPWLAILARRVALGYRRQKTQRQTITDKELTGLELDTESSQLLENIEQKEQYQLILSAVKSLPEKYRQVFILEHVNGLTYRQIAEILDVPVTTVQIRLVRARQMLYDWINEKNRVKER
ncbi:MAG: RNA polymerase sigma factor [Sedimentisphaerales bacterium]|nr:RNA polymerase sigma factor [Sedimentisphaerales bacterium]